MTRTAYFDCFAGASGDMMLGAFLDAGLPLEELRQELGRLALPGWQLEARPVKRAGLAATQAIVGVTEPQPPRTLPDVLTIIEGSGLATSERELAAAVFRRLAEAEARAHGESVESVHLHDVGAVDALVDVVGSVVGLRLLGVEATYASPLPTGSGEAKGRHGSLPVPSPATLELLARAGAPVVAGRGQEELVTPTGGSHNHHTGQVREAGYDYRARRLRRRGPRSRGMAQRPAAVAG